MKKVNLWHSLGRLFFGFRRLGFAMMTVLLLTVTSLNATVVNTLSGGPSVANPNSYFGYSDGNTATDVQFHTPSGLALDSSGTLLLLADRDNNAIRIIDLVAGETDTLFISDTNLIKKPIGVALDNADNIFILNRGNGTNGTILELDPYFGELIATNAVNLTNAAGIALDVNSNIYVTVKSNTVLKITPAGVSSVVATITNVGASLQGIAVKKNGLLAVCDAGRNGIYLIDPATGIATTNAGFHGVGDFPSGTTQASKANAQFNQPMSLLEAADGSLIVSDFGNNRVKYVRATDGAVFNLYGVNSNYWVGPLNPSAGVYPGWYDGTVQTPDKLGGVEARLPYGMAFAVDGTLYVSEDYYHIIRKVTGTGLVPAPRPPGLPSGLLATTNTGQITLTWAASSGATNYNVKRATSSGGPYTTIGNTAGTTFTDSSTLAGTTYYYVISAVNSGGESANSLEVNATLAIPPPPSPRIGWFDYEGNNNTGFYSTLHPVSTSFIVNNDLSIAIDPTVMGVATYYLAGSTPYATVPSSTNGSTPPFYQEHYEGYIQPLTLPLTTNGDITIKAVNVDGLGQSSPVISAQFIFRVGGPLVIGNNAAQFTLSDITSNSVFWYTFTTDGTTPPDPTNALPSIGPITNNPAIISLNANGSTNVINFKVRAFRNGYIPSVVQPASFLPGDFQANAITFGSSSGEPHSSFMARPGQFFYAPVTLQLLPNFDKMYSLQFNIAVTNGFTNVLTGNPSIPKIINGAGIDFFPMLMTKVTPVEGTYYPPADGSWYLTLPNLTASVNGTVTNIVQSQFVNTNNNLLGIGWLYRTGFKYLASDTNNVVYLDFDTTAQDLITYSIIHDTLFKKQNGVVAVGAYSFQIPQSATNGDQYFIQVGSPSATSDGVGAPGSAIFIATPALSQAVTVGSPAYIVGDVAPFHWLNAGDFGDTNLDNSDVMQVYQSAIELVNMPPLNSDLYAAMDSAGGIGVFDGVNNYYTNAFAYTNTYGVGSLTNLWNGNELTINSNAFGDGNLDINDLFVTLRRSLDPSLVWFKRYWTNGQFVAVTNANYAFNSNSPHLLLSKSALNSGVTVSSMAASAPTNYLDASVVFSAGDAIAGADSTIQIPITATVLGSYPLRVLGLNLTIHPLDGSPAIAQQITFTPSAAIGNPTLPPASKSPANYTAVWLDASIAGLSNTATIGTLTVKVPTNATPTSAYAVHFDFGSGSPNGLAVFPNQKFTGLITTAPRTNSYYGDGIPDSWRLRWFGTIYNALSQSNAIASGDGVSNWKKFIAGVDPTVAGSFPAVNPKSAVLGGYTAAIHWPSVVGKKYVIERSTTLFSGSWSVLSTNTGTGGDMEYNDNNASKTKFYRVRILP